MGVRRPGRCAGCTKPDHFYKNCPFRNARCRACHRIGHIGAACQALVVKDHAGRPKTMVHNPKGRTTVVQRQDGCTKDMLDSGAGILNRMKDYLVTRAKKQTQKAREKRERDPNYKPKLKKDHPVMVVEDGAEDEYDGEAEDDDIDPFETLADKMVALFEGCVFADISGVARTRVRVGDAEYDAILDNGASRSLCGTSFAGAQGLEPTGEVRQFSGLGTAEATVMRPIPVKIGTKTIDIAFSCIAEPAFPLLIGRPDLARLDVSLEMRSGRLYDTGTGELVARLQEIDDGGQPVIEAESRLDDEALCQQGIDVLMKRTGHLPDDIREQVLDIFKKHRTCWVKPQVGKVLDFVFKFEVAGPPVRHPLRRLPPELKDDLERQITRMLEAGVIQKSSSEWASCPVFARKKGGGWRLCLDFRSLNKRISGDAYPVPLLLDNIQKAAGKKFYCALDIQWAFWCLPLDESCRKYTAVVTHMGSYEFKVLPFGLKISPAVYQRTPSSEIYIRKVS